jgi:hypothetical protein
MARRPVTFSVIRRLALALPEATEGSHFAKTDFRVRNKIFAAFSANGDTVTFKTSPTNLDALVSADPETFRDAWRGRWMEVRLDRITVPLLRDLLADAWRLAAPKRLAAGTRLPGTRPVA